MAKDKTLNIDKRQGNMFELHDVVLQMMRLWLVRDGILTGDKFLEGDTWISLLTALERHGIIGLEEMTDALRRVRQGVPLEDET